MAIRWLAGAADSGGVTACLVGLKAVTWLETGLGGAEPMPPIPLAHTPRRTEPSRIFRACLSLLDHSDMDPPARLLEARQLTDTGLLALAVQRGGRLVSLDRRLSCVGVAGGREALWLIEA